MENFNIILQAISTVGFPIAMCLIIMYYFKGQDDRHDEEVKELSVAVNNNTKVMEKLISRIEDILK